MERAQSPATDHGHSVSLARPLINASDGDNRHNNRVKLGEIFFDAITMNGHGQGHSIASRHPTPIAHSNRKYLESSVK